MKPEDYKKYIKRMLERINDERDLSWIYAAVHRKFLKYGEDEAILDERKD